MTLEREDLDIVDREVLSVDSVVETEVFWDCVILETSIQNLYHVIIIFSSKHFEMFEVTHMSLLKLAEGDAGHYAGSLKLENQELWRSVRVRRPTINNK